MAYNTVAEIPGTDLKDELVMLGGHMDSWHAAPARPTTRPARAVAMEAVRILKALDLKPRRTIRIALWTGEEQGLLGSRAYVTEHFGARPSRLTSIAKALPSLPAEDQGRSPSAGARPLLGLLQPRQRHRQDPRRLLQGNEAGPPIFRVASSPSATWAPTP